MVNFSPLAAEFSLPVWGTPEISRVLDLGFVTALTSLNRGKPILHDVWLSPGLVHHIYIFGGSCPLTELYHVQNSLCVQVLHSPILAALLHGTQVIGVSQTLWPSAEGGTYIRQGGHYVGYRPTF